MKKDRKVGVNMDVYLLIKSNEGIGARSQPQ